MRDSEVEAELRRQALADPLDITPGCFPDLGTISAAFMYQWLPNRVGYSRPPEYVCIRTPRPSLRVFGAFSAWNIAWEAGPERNELFANRLPAKLRTVRRHPDVDFRFVLTHGRLRYPLYSPLYHLLPADTLRRFGLPLLCRAVWPVFDMGGAELVLPNDFEERLGQAVAYHIWPYLSPTRYPSSYSAGDPIRLLSHTLDFWLPYVDVVIQERMRALGPVRYESPQQRRLITRVQREAPHGVKIARPVFGGTVWRGEAEAQEATRRLIEIADTRGQLRAILDAVRTHRVEEDFSDRWSWAREDFERKLFQKRSKIRVSFVELRDTAPVIGPTSELEENLIWQDLLGLVDVRDRRVVVLLRSGLTKAVEIAQSLGYANHSPVSKALARIRERARQYFGQSN